MKEAFPKRNGFFAFIVFPSFPKQQRPYLFYMATDSMAGLEHVDLGYLFAHRWMEGKSAFQSR